jgi:hypothetical protein
MTRVKIDHFMLMFVPFQFFEVKSFCFLFRLKMFRLPFRFQQATIMNQTTNPFLASAASGASVPAASMSLFSDMRSLNLGPAPANNWMSAGVPVVPQPASGFETINPFTAGVAPAAPATSQSLFADFGQPVRGSAEPPALNWGLPAANPIQANKTLPSSDLWQ